MQKVDYCVHESDTYLGVARTMLSDDAVHFETFSRMRFTTKINASNLDGLVVGYGRLLVITFTQKLGWPVEVYSTVSAKFTVGPHGKSGSN